MSAKRYSYTDKGGDMRGSAKGNVIEIWDRCPIVKKEFLFSVTVEEVNYAVKQSNNSEYALYQLVKRKYHEMMERWIKSSPTEKLKRIRRENYFPATGKYFNVQDSSFDSSIRVVRNLYERLTGKEIKSVYEAYIEQGRAR